MTQIKTPAKNPWTDYWKNDLFWADCRIWEKNAEIFMRRIERIFPLSPEDTVLNIGCGSGFLEILLSPKVKEICSVDTSERFVRMTAERCTALGNVRTGVLGANYTDCRGFGNFSLFLCISVIQYYSDISEFKALVGAARDCAKPGAKMLIADIPIKHSFLEAVPAYAKTLMTNFKNGLSAEILRTSLRLFFKNSPYKQIRAEAKTLRFRPRELRELIRSMGLNAHLLKESFSACSDRISLLIDLDKNR